MKLSLVVLNPLKRLRESLFNKHWAILVLKKSLKILRKALPRKWNKNKNKYGNKLMEENCMLLKNSKNNSLEFHSMMICLKDNKKWFSKKVKSSSKNKYKSKNKRFAIK